MRSRWTCGLVLALALAVAATADASTFRGPSAGRETATLLATPGGGATSLEVGWPAPCLRRIGRRAAYTGFRLRGQRRRFSARTDRTSPVFEPGTLTVRPGFELRSRGTATGRRLSAYRWAGRLRADVTLLHDGKAIRRCASGAVRWRARAPHMRARIERDPSAVLDGPTSFSGRTPRDPLFAEVATARELSGYAGPFTFALRGQHLRAGTSTFDDAGTGGAPLTVDVGEDHLVCTAGHGTVTIHSVRTDRHGLRAIDVTFDHRCYEDFPAVRARIIYRR